MESQVFSPEAYSLSPIDLIPPDDVDEDDGNVVWSKNPNACFLQRLQTCHRLLNVLISSLLSPILTMPRAPKD
jgi:hypothetical protein